MLMRPNTPQPQIVRIGKMTIVRNCTHVRGHFHTQQVRLWVAVIGRRLQLRNNYGVRTEVQSEAASTGKLAEAMLEHTAMFFKRRRLGAVSITTMKKKAGRR